MNLQHFQSQLTRLIEVYGKNSFPQERSKVIWQRVEEFSDRWLTGIVDHFIGTCRYAPLLPEFEEEISKERERQSWIAKQNKDYLINKGPDYFECKECKDTGKIVTVKEQYGTPGLYAYRCNCKAGNRYPKYAAYDGI